MFKTKHEPCDRLLKSVENVENMLTAIKSNCRVLHTTDIDIAISELCGKISRVQSLIENTGILYKSTIDDVKSGKIGLCCTECATKYRDRDPYDGTYNIRVDQCQICKKTTDVTSAYKLFGYHKFI